MPAWVIVETDPLGGDWHHDMSVTHDRATIDRTWRRLKRLGWDVRVVQVPEP